MKFTVVGSNSELIVGGDYSLDVEFLGIPVTSEKGDLCDASSGQISVQCPVAAADNTSIVGNFEIPDSSPEGDYAITIAATTTDKKEIFCVEIDFSLDGDATEATYLRNQIYEA